MKPRSFTTKVETCHKKWLSKILGMKYSKVNGIDIYDDKTGIELKSRYEIYNHSFAIHEYQIGLFEKTNNGKKLYWAFLFYGLSESLDNIKNKNIEKFVSNRQIWFLEWDWVKQFPISYPKTGPYVYVKEKDFPDEDKFSKLNVNGAKLYMPKNSNLEKKINTP